MKCRRAEPPDLNRLRAITVAAKAHWGHDLAWSRAGSLDHDVEPSLPVATAGRQHDVPVGSEIHGLLLVFAGGEVDGVVEPDSDEWRDVRSTVAPNSRDPEQLGTLRV